MIRNLRFPWWARWLPVDVQSANISNQGIELVSRKGPQTIDWVMIESMPDKGHAWFTHHVSVHLPSGAVRLYFGSKAHRDEAWVQIVRAWYTPRIIGIKNHMARFAHSLPREGYVRSSQWQPIAQQIHSLRPQLPPAPPEGILESEQSNFLRATIDFVQTPDAWLKNSRERYIQQTLSRHQKLFDTVESKPLSPKQREACVIDEDNNLILAGAGTGKTSTVIGRVAFLVQSGQARPEEILLLAYGSTAAAEMRERLEKRLGVKGVTAETFHALGRYIVEYVEDKEASVSAMANDAVLKTKFVDQTFERLQQEDPQYRQLLLTYFEHWLFPAKNPFDFKTLGDYYQFLNDNNVRTLKSEKVKGFGECDIANFLFKNGVEYQYEALYKTPEQSRERGPYKPDFFLPDYGIYIEHFGIDEQGKTAPYIDCKKYHDDMAWKRKVHGLAGTPLIETYHHQKQKGTLLTVLEESLLKAGVTLNPLPPEAVLETLREFGVITEFSKILTEMLGLLKAANLSEQERTNLARSSPQVSAALDLLTPISEAYERKLREDNQVDFDDMINRATAYLLSGKFDVPWRYIVVDEFQDIAKSRAQLVQMLREKRGDVSLFCVGDDWQSIYRFTGSDISFTSRFRERFGPTSISDLDKTFRFNSKIGDVASRFVMQNSSQLTKQITSHEAATDPTVSLLRTEKSTEDARYQVVDRIHQIAPPNSSVYFLARFTHDLPENDELRRFKNLFPNLNFKTDTIHRSKGKEADYVVVLGLTKGKYGLPSEIVTHPLIEALLPEREAYPHAEERRLFYVALTRAKHRVYLPCDMRKCSPFVQELVKGEYPLDLDEFAVSDEQLHALEANCPVCKLGYLVARTNKNSGTVFMGCTNYPRCEHTENSCQRCNSPMETVGRFRQCVKASCGWWIPICPLSGGEMSYKQAFKFWGCSDYRSNDPKSCRHKEYGQIGAPPARPQKM
ncbi:helicase IV [Pseudomonas sp. AU11447]|nr:helicase IV [Pseudomonas sp. AU11447]